MAGALLQLVAYGAQDVYLTGNPQITFFKAVYRRHTNFAMESMRQTLNGVPEFDGSVVCKVKRNGDLIGRTYVRNTLTVFGGVGINANTNRMVNRAGFALLKNVELRVGGQLVDSQTGLWMHCWTELSHTRSQKDMLDGLVGTTANNGSVGGLGNEVFVGIPPQDTGTRTLTTNTPLQFSYCRHPGLAIPLIALQYHDVELMFDLASQGDVTQSGTVTLGSEMEVWIDYIFLDTEERKNFAENSHEYLIETVQSRTSSMGAGATESVRLNFNHPVKELVWVGSGNVTNGDNFNQNNGSVLTRGILKLNGQNRFSERNYRYFQHVQPNQHHTGCPDFGINSYSFAIKPEEHQPSGTCNFSRIDNAELELTSTNATTVTVFAHGYNVLRVASGMGGLAYSN
jgi:hypothetical protein